MTAQSVFETSLPGLRFLGRGKVRDIYEIDPEHLLFVTTDRLSAFDVVFSQPIPGKGEVLNRVSNFWFKRTSSLISNHLADMPIAEILPDGDTRKMLGDRVIVVRRVQPLKVEAIVRGYIIGSGWKEYQAKGGICGIQLQPGLKLAEKLPEPIFTPSTKADIGAHDENIDFSRTIDVLGRELAERVRDISTRIYIECAAYALERGIIIADTKFEFGLDKEGQLYLIDEILTPDSSRFWPAEAYRPGANPPSFDKQYVRDYLETLNWDKNPPAPSLPEEIITKTAEKYLDAERRLTNRP